ncbi:MAG: GFA family protein [Rhodobacteraceae bacterium]|nr:GFA family protein [Paracoccaceae bacterium]
MRLEGSCHCKAVSFAVEAPQPYPFNLCYCSICRKTAGAGGYAINLGALVDSLEVEGWDHIRSYNAILHERLGAQSTGQRKFCGICGSALWIWDPTWPDLIHPHASAIDTELPISPERVHMMLGSRANWAVPCLGPNDRTFDEYPDESLAEWHDRLGLTS